MISVLIDVSTLRILVASDESGSINLLHSADGNTLCPVLKNQYKVINAPKVKDLKALARADEGTWLNYYLDSKAYRIVHDKTTPAISDRLRARAAFYRAKFNVLSKVSAAINASRRRLQRPASYEDTTRRLKKEQAAHFRSTGYDMTRLHESIFVWQYAEVHGIEPKEAAERLLLESEFFEAELWKSEGIKMRYWNRILECTDPKKLNTINADFKREFWVNALV